jgi:uncharacterized protein YlxP (DUF503 family)
VVSTETAVRQSLRQQRGVLEPMLQTLLQRFKNLGLCQ